MASPFFAPVSNLVVIVSNYRGDLENESWTFIAIM